MEVSQIAISYRQARKYLSLGDVVYTTNGKQIVPAQICRIALEYLDTDVDILYFEDHGTLWWLTEKVAKERCYGSA